MPDGKVRNDCEGGVLRKYLAGLYYRYDYDNWYSFATLFGGIPKADMSTKDSVKSDTDGVSLVVVTALRNN